MWVCVMGKEGGVARLPAVAPASPCLLGRLGSGGRRLRVPQPPPPPHAPPSPPTRARHKQEIAAPPADRGPAPPAPRPRQPGTPRRPPPHNQRHRRRHAQHRLSSSCSFKPPPPSSQSTASPPACAAPAEQQLPPQTPFPPPFPSQPPTTHAPATLSFSSAPPLPPRPPALGLVATALHPLLPHTPVNGRRMPGELPFGPAAPRTMQGMAGIRADRNLEKFHVFRIFFCCVILAPWYLHALSQYLVVAFVLWSLSCNERVDRASSMITMTYMWLDGILQAHLHFLVLRRRQLQLNSTTALCLRHFCFVLCAAPPPSFFVHCLEKGCFCLFQSSEHTTGEYIRKKWVNIRLAAGRNGWARNGHAAWLSIS